MAEERFFGVGVIFALCSINTQFAQASYHPGIRFHRIVEVTDASFDAGLIDVVPNLKYGITAGRRFSFTWGV